MCPALPPLSNGRIEYSELATSIGFMATATYICNIGFGLNAGDSVRTCGASTSGAGDWSGSEASCEGNLHY